MSLEQGVFFFFAILSVLAAFGVIFQKNAVHSVLYLLVNFASLAVLYLLLDAQFVAVAQVAIYAGAIVVLFLFVVTLLGGEFGEREDDSRRWMYVAVVLGLVLLTLTGTMVYDNTMNGAQGSDTPELIAQTGNVQLLGEVMFTRYLLPFEMASVLLLTGMVGILVLTRIPDRRK
jgi:NADH-quinone oxidoreductase subunit J